MSVRRKQNYRPSAYEVRKYRERIKKFMKYVGRNNPYSGTLHIVQETINQPKIRKIEVI